MTDSSFWQRQAATLKGIVIFFLVLVLLIPALMIQNLIRERESRQFEAINEVSSKWGQRQVLTGPILVVPYEEPVRAADGRELGRETRYAYFLPEQLNASGDVQPEKRYRGIYEVVLYSGDLTLEGRFARPAVEAVVPAGATVLWSRAVLALGIPDLRGLRDQVTLRWNDSTAVFDPGIPVPGVSPSGIHVPLALDPSAPGPYAFRLGMALKGSGQLFVTPVGKVTELQLRSPWRDPSFTGAFLPEEKQIGPAGFDARWRVLNLNRNYPQQWTSQQEFYLQESAFGVDFLLPVDNYQKSTRSVKYAVLFIGLTFLTVFFIEMRQTRRVHPFQYALIGLALVIFYTLLVALSEHTSFNAAYFTAAVMTIALTGLYARSLFASGRMALLVAGTLALLYGFLFVVLQQQDYALLIGSLGLFAILAMVMYFSRQINWEKA